MIITALLTASTTGAVPLFSWASCHVVLFSALSSMGRFYVVSRNTEMLFEFKSRSSRKSSNQAPEKSQLIRRTATMTRKRWLPESLAVASCKSLKKGKVKAIPAFQPIIRTRGQARNEAQTRLNNNNISVLANDLQGPKIPVKRSIAVVSIHPSKLKTESPAVQMKTEIEFKKTGNAVDMPTKGVPSSHESQLKTELPALQMKTEIELEKTGDAVHMPTKEVPSSHKSQLKTAESPALQMKTEIEFEKTGNAVDMLTIGVPSSHKSQLKTESPTLQLKMENEYDKTGNAVNMPTKGVPRSHKSQLKTESPAVQMTTENG
jgi:hypothetical protein